MRASTVSTQIVFIAIIVSIDSSAQSWKAAVDGNLTLNQSAYSNSWVGGEAGAVTWSANTNASIEKRIFSRVYNKNVLKLAFGQTHNQDKETRHWARPAKSTDLVDFESTFRLALGGFVEPIAAFRVLSQFVDGRDPARKRYANPVVLTESFGVTRVFLKKEKREWSARIGAGFRQTVDRDKLDPLTGDRKKDVEKDGGLEFVMDLLAPLAMERIVLTSKLTIFQAIFSSEADELRGLPNENDWKRADVNLENILTVNVTRYLMVNLYTQLLYDKQIDRALRFKQTLALGVTLKVI